MEMVSCSYLAKLLINSIPSSSHKLPDIFRQFSVNPNSREAEIVKNTLQECEAIKGEEKLRATSLESMVDFSTSRIGKHVEAISTKAKNGSKVNKYSTVGVKKISGGNAVVACHKLVYPFIVFYCNMTKTTDVYQVLMVASDGTK
ncbi:BURP domain protein RD22-like [Henckelia pumila]|uniref:BURP domain protein RD22-like n=1 Tax=Henckelia pumila TaxID=405737 RepID=UPI003C6E83AF